MNTLITALILLTGVIGYNAETHKSDPSTDPVKVDYTTSNLLSSTEDYDFEYDDDAIPIKPENLPDCGKDTNMNSATRFVVLEKEIALRLELANGQVKNGNNTRPENFPTASDMSLQTYDCGLERAAFNISKMCHSLSDYNFANVGSNIASYVGPIDDIDDIIRGLMGGWWNTSMQSSPLVNLTPTADNIGMIPFLQMANANTTKIGCAYSVCNSSRDGCDNSLSSIVFVCSYGDPPIQLNNPIYTEGRPCGTCNNTCAHKSLCNRTTSTIS
ncbi:hypothetical protein KIN20_007706 [Parelaphostrongylus tenuis]|uniref:SCP domain-containing protein n=1 Tax=Parelaphostrongylus tenuis TaxID=148309 RepID=A0AAD5M5U5_PARTN|nr:hypothetical protein KIN20_007706 [Parelaphostrongylus tenuis]